MVGKLASTAVAGSASWMGAGPPQGTGSSAGAGRGGDRESWLGGEPPALQDTHLTPQPMWRHLRWLCGWPWGPGPGRQEGPCQPGHGAGDLRWLPHAAQPPQPRHLQEGSTEVSWKDCGRGRDSPVPGYLQRREPHPTIGTRPIVRAWKITALGCSYEKWVPT